MEQKPATISLRSIRLRALGLALTLAFMASARSLSLGDPWSRAAWVGLLLAMANITAWGVYHLLSGTRNGLMTASMPFASHIGALERHQDIGLARMLLVSGMIGIVTAFIALWPEPFFRKRQKPAPVEHPMADASLDVSPTS